MTRICPECNRTLATSVSDGIEVDVCQFDHGMWLDSGELAMLVEQRSEALDSDVVRELLAGDRLSQSSTLREQLQAAPRACPKCGKDMQRRLYPEWSYVVIDVDPCGTWLDRGELERIVAWHVGGRPASYDREDAAQVHGDFARLQARIIRGDGNPPSLLGRVLDRITGIAS